MEINSASGHIGIYLSRGPEWWKRVKATRVVFVPGVGYSIPGEVGYYDGSGKPIGIHHYELVRLPVVQSLPFSTVSDQHDNSLGFGLGRHFLIVPHWFCVIVLGSFAVTPWLQSRFSLRTLLIATTLVAVVLGLAVYVSR